MWSPAAGQVQDRECLGRLARRQKERGHPAFQGGDPLFDDVGGRVADAGVDVARDFQAEQRRSVGGVVEDVGRGLVDRQGAGAGGRVRRLAGVHLLGLERPVRGRIGVGVVRSGHGRCFLCEEVLGVSGAWGCTGRRLKTTYPAANRSATATHDGPAQISAHQVSLSTRGARHSGPALADVAGSGYSTWSSPGAPHRGWRVAGQQAGA